jgi:SNF2 family DNA or RNA helicase
MPVNSANVVSLQQTNAFMGKIKDTIKYDAIAKSPNTYKNEEFVKFVNDSNYSFIAIPGYYDDDVKSNFDIYGTSYIEKHNDIEFNVKTYFYNIKNPELLTKEFIQKYKLIFQYDYFIKNNVLNMEWHSYRLGLFCKDIETQKFYNLAYQTPYYCRTKLFHHQINNISQMLRIYNNPVDFPISDNLIMSFENGLNYDFVKNEFVEPESITKYKLHGGMILDEPGTGKTLQFILFLLECKKKSLILVPNDGIKNVWIGEFKKHFGYNIVADTFYSIADDGNKYAIDIMTFDDLNILVETDKTVLDKYEIIGIDEIHILYTNIKTTNKKTKYESLLDAIISSKISSRWGLTGTPFVNDLSLFNIIRYLMGHNFVNERIANIPSIQNQIMPAFLKNLKINMTDDYAFPELTIGDIFVELDIVQSNLYNVEAGTTFNKTNLRKLVSEVQLLFDKCEIKSPTELKLYGVAHYKQLYEEEVAKLHTLEQQFENITQNKERFSDELEFLNRREHYKQMINHQNEVMKRHKAGLEYFMKTIETISNIFENKEVEGHCPICFDDYSPPIKYFKQCGHYFCGSCIDSIFENDYQVGNLVMRNVVKCPMCRRDTRKDEIISVSNVAEINDSPKIYEIVKIIKEFNEKFIIFSQFDILDKFHTLLNKKNIKTQKYTEYVNSKLANPDVESDTKVLLLSSGSNAEGINLSMFDRLVIFEPFEDHMYCREIEKQLIGRIHRVGRVKPVNVYRLITKNTIEEEIYMNV